MPPREELIGEIQKAEELLGRLEAEQGQARTLLAALRVELVSQLQAEPPVQVRRPNSPPQPAPQSPEEKVRLFRQLFRGRGDVFPTRFVSKKTGKPGYAPACTNKFVRGVCELPKVKCGECPNQAFVPVDDTAVIAHLQGRHVMGVYPLLEDQTCWFLAVDFDKSTWTEDVRAFVTTCRQVGLPAAVERSRSGNGAHVWFFFAEPRSAFRSSPFYRQTDRQEHGPRSKPQTWTRRQGLAAQSARSFECEANDEVAPSPPPVAAEWIEAYRYWVGRV